MIVEGDNMKKESEMWQLHRSCIFPFAILVYIAGDSCGCKQSGRDNVLA